MKNSCRNVAKVGFASLAKILVLTAVAFGLSGRNSLAQSCAPTPAGLFASWSGDGNGADSIDGQNATLMNGAGYAAGKVGTAFAFNGIDQYAQVPSSSKWAFGSADFSIEFWVKLTSAASSQAFLACDAGANGHNKWVLWLNNGTLEMAVYNAGVGPSHLGSVAYSPSLDEWHHLAITRSGSAFTLYADGAVISRATSSVVIPDALAPLTFGSAEGTFFLNGEEDEISFYNRALTDNEINLIYRAGSLGKCSVPITPVVLTPPQSQTVYERALVTFNSLISGTGPLVYQWGLNGTNLASATASSLVLTNVQFTDSGSYVLVISNAYGMVTSAVATLTVNPRSCAEVSNGLLGWWGGEGTAQDSFGTNHGTLVNGAGFMAGEVGQAFNFDPSGGQCVIVPYNPALALGVASNDFTIELWMRPTVQDFLLQPLVANEGGGNSANEWALSWNFSVLEFAVASVPRPLVVIHSSAFTPALNQWHHVALTHQGTVFSFYGDGVLLSAVTNSVAMPNPATALAFGRLLNSYAGYSPAYFRGAEDEIALYNRSLSAPEIARVYNAGYLGRCVTTAPPVVVLPPASKSVAVDVTVNLSAIASGVAPLRYQWLFNGNPLTGATNSTLTLTHLQLTNAGGYICLVANSYGIATSAVATLTVNPPICAAITNGLVSWWTAEGNGGDLAGTNALTLVNGAGYTSGEVGQAFSFNGTGQYAQAAASSAWGLGTNDFTIELWVKLAANGTCAFLADDAGPGNANKWIFWLNGGVLQLAVTGVGGGLLKLGSGSFNPSLNEWHHVAVTRSGNTFTLYADGAVSSTVSSSINIPNPGVPLTLGSAEGQFFLNGAEDEVSIYHRALSLDEIYSIYAAGSLGKCLPETPPTLRASTSPAGLVLTWPANALGYTVQISTNLGSGTWTTVAATPAADGLDQSVTLTVTPGAQRYYRLYHP